MFTTILLCVCLPLLFGIYIYMLNNSNNLKNYPPGPLRLPIIGTGYNSDAYYTKNRYASMRQKYGDIFMLHGCKFPLVILNTFDDIKEAANKNACSDRGVGLLTYSKHIGNTNGLVSSDYTDAYHQTRKWHMSIMRELGMRTSIIDQIVIKECEELVQHFKSFNGETFNPAQFIHLFAINAVMSMLLNKHFDIHDPDFVAMARHAAFLTDAGLPVLEYEGCPLLMQFSSKHSKARRQFIDSQVWTQQHMLQCIEERMKMGDIKNGDTTCYLDHWIDKCRDSGVAIDKQRLSVIMGELINAGTDPIAAALQWLMLYLANNPEIQARTRNEIEVVIGCSGNHVTWERRNELPFVQALIMETQRVSNASQIGLNHFTYTATKLGPYDIPAKSFLLFNIGAVLMNETTFEDPKVFRPERFLDDKGTFVPHPHMIPFGTGKRSCGGEMLAKQELFLFTVTMLKKFVFRPPYEVQKVEVEAEPGFVHYPKGLRIIAECR